MKTRELIYKKMFYFLCVTLFITMFTSCDYGIIRESKLQEAQEAQEYAYFEGQRDAIENDIRIKRDQNGCWIWIKSPWDNNKPPIYNPSYNCK